MIRRTPRSTRTETHLPYTTLFRSLEAIASEHHGVIKMTDETKTAEATKTVDDIKSRMVFDSPAAALSYVGEISDYEGFGALTQAIVGLLVDDDGNPVVDDEGNPQLDPAISDSTMQVAVAFLSEKDTGTKKLVPVGLAVYPTQAPEAVAATEEGAKWIAKLVEKETNLIERKRDGE